MNKYNRFMLMFAPEGGESSAGPAVVETISAPGVDVPVLESSVTPDVTPVTIANVETEGGVKSPADLFGEDSQALMDEADEKMGKKIDKDGRERGPDGKFLPKKADEKTGKPAAKTAEEKTPAKPADVIPAMSKIKIEDREMTPEEIAAELKDLRAKAEAATKAPEEKKPTESETEASKTQALEASRKAYLDHELARTDDIDEPGLDTILAGGKDAVAKFREIRAKDKLEIREWAANAVNKLLKPILEREDKINQFQEENGVLAANPELKATPKGIDVYRTVKDQFETSYQGIKAKGDQATPQERAWLAAYDAQTPEGLREAIANHAKAELVKLNPPSPNAKTPVLQQVAKPIRPTKPFNGDKPGGVSSPKSESSQAKFVREMGMDV